MQESNDPTSLRAHGAEAGASPAPSPQREGAPPRVSQKPRRILAFMNQKGGVGKTTTTVNIASAFARAGRSTLLVDLDPQAHASLHLGVDPGSLERSVYDVFADPLFDPVLALHRSRDNLLLLPADTNLAGTETELVSASDKQFRLTKALDRLATQAEFVLIDCPPSLGLLTLNGLVAAGEVVVPMQAHFLALQGVGKLLETIQAVKQGLNPALRVAGVVLCNHDNGNTHSREVVADMKEFFEQGRTQPTPWQYARVLSPAVRRNIKLAEAPSFGKTIFEYAPAASGSEDYNALAWGLMGEWDAAQANLLSQRSVTGVGAAPSMETPRTDQPTIALPAVRATAGSRGAGAPGAAP